jgi:hypothetical protein
MFWVILVLLQNFNAYAYAFSTAVFDSEALDVDLDSAILYGSGSGFTTKST